MSTMRSIKIALKDRNYPLFIDAGLINRINEFCDLYRFPAQRFIITNKKDYEKLPEPLSGFADSQIIKLPRFSLHSDFNSALKLFDFIPWDQLNKTATLIGMGDEWLICSVALAKQMAAIPLRLVCVPVSFWSMIETGVNNKFLVDWKKNPAAIQIKYDPDLVLLDANFLNLPDSGDPLLGIVVILRHLLVVNPDIFHLFKANIPDVFDKKTEENIQIIEELISSRFAIFKDVNDERCLQDFGLRFANSFRYTSKENLTEKELAVLVLVEICWRWKISKMMSICQAKETESIFALIEKICITQNVTSRQWNDAKMKIAGLVQGVRLQDIFLPETVGKFRCVESVDLSFARRCLQDC